MDTYLEVLITMPGKSRHSTIPRHTIDLTRVGSSVSPAGNDDDALDWCSVQKHRSALIAAEQQYGSNA